MASIRECGTSESLDRALRTLARRRNAVDLGASLAALALIVPVVLILPGGLFGLGGLLLLIFAVTVGAVFPLLGRMRALRYGKVPAVLNGLAGLMEWNVRGLALVCRLRSPDPTVPPLTLSVSGDEVGMRLTIPWDAPADVLTDDECAFSDLPGLWEEVDAIRIGLRGFYEFVRTDLKHGLLVSVVRPAWNLWTQPEESSDAVRDRILDRWRHMESLRKKAASERVFAPRLVKAGRPLEREPGWHDGWCPTCWEARVVRSDEESECRTCHTRLWVVWSNNETGRGIQAKMDQVRSRYAI